MIGAGVRLGAVFGIPIRASYSWFVIVALLTWAMASAYYPAQYPRWPSALHWTLGLATSLFFFASVLAHELAHSLVSRRLGIPVHGITLFIFGGVSQIAREVTSPRVELLVAIVGPFCSMGIALLFALAWLAVSPFNRPLAALASSLAFINLTLGLFNLLPGFPLDGGRVLRALVWGWTGSMARATRLAARAGQAIGYLLILGGLLLALRGDLMNGLWLVFVGWFLENVAASSYRQAGLSQTLRGLTAGDILSQEYPTLSRALFLDAAVEEHLLPSCRTWFLVTDRDRLVGLLTLPQIKGVRRSLWPATTVQDAMIPIHQVAVARPADEALGLLERMEQIGVAAMPVVDDGRVVGVAERARILAALHIRNELGV
ncbi:MAG: site-2 protease family protein [Chloroflexi bacterium]|nr:site-2 protease family protein [Chloroflexota bacterium]